MAGDPIRGPYTSTYFTPLYPAGEFDQPLCEQEPVECTLGPEAPLGPLQDGPLPISGEALEFVDAPAGFEIADANGLTVFEEDVAAAVTRFEDQIAAASYLHSDTQDYFCDRVTTANEHLESLFAQLTSPDISAADLSAVLGEIEELTAELDTIGQFLDSAAAIRQASMGLAFTVAHRTMINQDLQHAADQLMSSFASIDEAGAQQHARVAGETLSALELLVMTHSNLAGMPRLEDSERNAAMSDYQLLRYELHAVPPDFEEINSMKEALRTQFGTLAQTSVRREIAALAEVNYGPAWRNLISRLQSAFQRGVDENDPQSIDQSLQLLAIAKGYHESREQISQIEERLADESLPEAARQPYRTAIRRLRSYGRALLTNRLQVARQQIELAQTALNQAAEIDNVGTAGQLQQAGLQFITSIQREEIQSALGELGVPESRWRPHLATAQTLIGLLEDGGTLSPSQFRALRTAVFALRDAALLGRAQVFLQYNNENFLSQLGDDRAEVEDALSILSAAVEQGEIDANSVRSLDHLSRTLPGLIRRVVRNNFDEALISLDDGLWPLRQTESDDRVQLGAAARRVGTGNLHLSMAASLQNIRGGANGAYNVISQHRANAAILDAINESDDIEALRRREPAVDMFIREMVSLNNCHTAADLANAVHIVQLLNQRGQLPRELSSAEAQHTFLEAVRNHQVIEGIREDVAAWETIRDTGIAVGITVIAAAAAEIGAGAIVGTITSRAALPGAVTFLFHNFTSALIFNVTHRALAVGVGLEENFFQSGEEFGWTTLTTFGMFMVLRGAGKGFGALAPRVMGRLGMPMATSASGVVTPLTTGGRLLYGAGAFATEVGALTAYGLGHQLIEAHYDFSFYRGPSVAQLLTGEHIGNSLAYNTAFLIGLRGGNALARPALTRVRSAMLRRTSIRLGNELARIEVRETEAIREGNAEGLLSAARERLGVYRRLESTGIIEQAQVRDLESRIERLREQIEPAAEEAAPVDAEVTVVETPASRRSARGVEDIATADTVVAEEASAVTRRVAVEQVEARAESGEVRLEAESAIPRFEIQLDFQNYVNQYLLSRDVNSGMTLEQASARASTLEANRARLMRENPDIPVFEAEAREQASTAWREFQAQSSAAKEAVNDFLRQRGVEDPASIRPEALLELSPELRIFFGEASVTAELSRIHVELNGLRLAAQRASRYNGARPEWIEELTLEEGWFTSALSSDAEVGRIRRSARVASADDVVHGGAITPGQVMLVDGRLYRIETSSDGSYSLQRLELAGADFRPTGERQTIDVVDGEATPVSLGERGASLLVTSLSGEVSFTLVPPMSRAAAGMDVTRAGAAFNSPTLEINLDVFQSAQSFFLRDRGIARVVVDGEAYIINSIGRGHVNVYLEPARSNDCIIMEPVREGASSTVGRLRVSREAGLLTVEAVSAPPPAPVRLTPEVIGSRRVSVVDDLPLESSPLVQQMVARVRAAEIEFRAAEIEAPLGLFGDRVNAENYVELRNVTEFRDGDILPGSSFERSRPESFGRELLTVNTGSSSAFSPVLMEARRVGTGFEGNMLELAIGVSDMVARNFSTSRGSHEAGHGMTIGAFMENGGVCRHRSAALQMALQEAGVPSRYVRGDVLGGGRHAWVEVDIRGDGSYSYVIDPMRGTHGEAQPLDIANVDSAYTVGNRGYAREGFGATIWRARRQMSAAELGEAAVDLAPAYPIYSVGETTMADIPVPQVEGRFRNGEFELPVPGLSLSGELARRIVNQSHYQRGNITVEFIEGGLRLNGESIPAGEIANAMRMAGHDRIVFSSGLGVQAVERIGVLFRYAEQGNIEGVTEVLGLCRGYMRTSGSRTRLPGMNAREVIRVLRRMGFEEARTNGHLIMRHPSRGISIPIPMHGSRAIAQGTLRSIVRQAGYDAFVEQLR